MKNNVNAYTIKEELKMRKLNKLVACLLAGVMTVSVVACGNPEGNGAEIAETPASVEASVETATEEATPAPAEVVKPETITVMWDGTIFKEGDNYAEEFYAALDEALGLHVEWIRPDHSTYSEQVGIAFNDPSTLADVVILPYNYYVGYAAQGSLWNMTDAWNNSEVATSGRLIEGADSIINNFWYVNGVDGNKGIYGMYPARGNGCTTYIKAVDAKKAGYTQETLPTNWAEYQDFLLALKDATGVAPVLAAAAGGSASGLLTHEAPYTNYLPEFWQDAYPEFYQKDGVWVDGFSEQATIDALDRLAWGYQNGVIDAQIFEAPSTANTRDKFYLPNSTSVFTYWTGNWALTITNKLKSNYDADAAGCTEEEYMELFMLPALAEMNGYVERSSPMICITSACKNPEGVFKYFVDPILDGGKVQLLWNHGVENVHYKWEDGKMVYLATQASAGTDKETMTKKNLFEDPLRLAGYDGMEIGELTEVEARSFDIFNNGTRAAYNSTSSDTYAEYSATLWQKKDELITAVAKGEMTGAEAIANYNETCGAIVEAVLTDFNS